MGTLTNENIQNAWNLASIAHNGQCYINANGIELQYLNHIGAVINELYSFFYIQPDYNVELAIICAILHDVLEDTNITKKEIEKSFGIEVANGVSALTKNNRIVNKDFRLLDSLNRILLQPLVKIADRIVNLQAPPQFWNKEKIKNYYDESLIIYNELKHCNHTLSVRLQCKIINYLKYL